MTSSQATFAEYVISAKQSLLHAIGLAQKLSGQIDQPIYASLAECQAALRHLQSAVEVLQPALNAEFGFEKGQS